MSISNGSSQYSHEFDNELTVFWCLKGKATNMIAYNAPPVEWLMPQILTNVTSAPLSKLLCFCTVYRMDSQIMYSCTDWHACNPNCEEVFMCQYFEMMAGSSEMQTHTLSFTHSVYGMNNAAKTQEPLSLPTSQLITTTSCLMECPSTTCSLQETPNSNLSSIMSMSILSSLSSSISSSCSSTVTEQVSTTPHYAGIGLLVATNLITIILLISSCVYISSQRKKSKL